MKQLVIDRNSWHYQFITKYSDYSPPDDLCRYCRKILFLTGFMIAMGVAGGYIVMALLASWWAAFRYYIMGISDFDGLFGEDMAVIFILFQVCGVIIAGGVFGAERFKRWWRNRPEHEPTPPGIFKLWWRAHRDKICPMLTFSQH